MQILDSSLVHRNRLAGFQEILNVQVDSFPYIRAAQPAYA
jgi:hypothetical protein